MNWGLYSVWSFHGLRDKGLCSVLTRNIPELQPHHSLSIPVQHLQSKVHPDGGPVVGGEVLVDIALDDAGFAHSQVPDHQQLVEVLLLVVLLHLSCGCSLQTDCMLCPRNPACLRGREGVRDWGGKEGEQGRWRLSPFPRKQDHQVQQAALLGDEVRKDWGKEVSQKVLCVCV